MLLSMISVSLSLYFLVHAIPAEIAPRNAITTPTPFSVSESKIAVLVTDRGNQAFKHNYAYQFLAKHRAGVLATIRYPHGNRPVKEDGPDPVTFKGSIPRPWEGFVPQQLILVIGTSPGSSKELDWQSVADTMLFIQHDTIDHGAFPAHMSIFYEGQEEQFAFAVFADAEIYHSVAGLQPNMTSR